ncbi:MAG: hypothetical protein ABJP45_04820 [Cyclobacteriaceae bacterium]
MKIKVTGNWIFGILALLAVSAFILYKSTIKKIEIGEGLAGIGYSESEGFYEQPLLQGRHSVSVNDTIIIYDIKPFRVKNFIESRFKDTLGLVEFNITLSFRLDSLSKVHYNFGELYVQRFVEPTIYYAIRKCTEKFFLSDTIENHLAKSIEDSEIGNFFLIEELSLKIPVDRTSANYTKALDRVITVLNRNEETSQRMILMAMPQSANQAQEFYELDYDETTSEAFNKLNKIILEYVMDGKGEFILRYLKMSQWVDGYFAEVYFDYLENLADKKSEQFCDEFGSLDESERKRIAEFGKACN